MLRISMLSEQRLDERMLRTLRALAKTRGEDPKQVTLLLRRPVATKQPALPKCLRRETQ